ncbi:MAG: hypothetical protein HC843_13410 [Sphingomonadales bacterium]|nr:hypothetical protein [Sphingomonadales bacterium]
MVISHWFVDLLVHAPDLTLLGGPPKLGFGLWDYPLIAMPLELGLTGAALGYYWMKAGVMQKAILRPMLWLAGAMLLLQLYNWLAPEAEQVGIALPLSAIIVFLLFVWLAFRVDRARARAKE